MKASSESGLWATVISRTSGMMLVGIFSVSDTAIRCEPQDLLHHATGAVPTGCNACGQHHLQDFSGHEPIQAKISGLGERVSKDVEPAQSTDEQKKLGQDAGDGCAHEGLSSMLKDVAYGECYQWVGQQESTRGSEQLCDSTGAGRIEDWQAGHSFDEIKRHGSKAFAASEQQADQQHAEVLDGQRNGRERHQRNRNVRAQRNKKTCSRDQRDLPRDVE